MSKKPSTSSRNVKRHSADDRIAAIVDAVIQIVARHGIENFRLHDVAVEAGVSVGAIQHHFQSRAVLLEQALHRYAMKAVDEALAVASRTYENAWAQLSQVLHEIASRTELESRDRIWVMLNASATINIQHLRIVQAIQARWDNMLRDVLTRGIAEGTFEPIIPVQDAVDCLLTVIDGTGLRNAVYGVPSPESVEQTETNLMLLATWLLRPTV